MGSLLIDLFNQISLPITTFVLGVIFMYAFKAIGFIDTTKVSAAISTIASNDSLRAIAKHLCLYAQKYVSEIALDKINYVVKQLEIYCKQCGLKITKEQVLEIAQSTYDENRSEISKIKFVKDLGQIIKDENNEELINKTKNKKSGNN